MMCFYAELRFSGKGKKRVYTNNGEISFSEAEFKYNKVGASQTYINARNKLIEVGFIQITYRGGFTKGDCNMYRVLVPGRDVPENEQRWRFYPQKNWKHEIPREKTNQVGIKTRYTPKAERDTSPINKGVCGKKELK